MRNTTIFFFVLVSLLSIVACGGSEEPHFRPRAAAQPRTAPPSSAPPPSAPPPSSAAPSSGTVTVTPPPAPPPASGPVVPDAPEPVLLSPAALTEHAPPTFSVELTTTEGVVIIDVTRAWSPNGADRFYNLVRAGFYDDVAFFRVIDGFMAQCGIHGSPQVARAWQHATIPDDPPAHQHNARGYVSFATSGPSSRTTQFFINFGDNSRLDAMGFTPFGRVRDMTNVDALYHGYGEGAPAGHGPQQQRIQTEGNTYLRAEFPELDYIVSARLLP